MMTAGGEPVLVDEADGYAILYKPPRIHCVPLKPGEGGTLLEWYARRFPAVLNLRGKKDIEGGMVHRLDYETSGLVLAARTQGALDFFLSLQEEGKFVKEYGALTSGNGVHSLPPGFPPSPETPRFPPFCIASYFRPYGPGRKAVRPVTVPEPGKAVSGDRGRPYETEVVDIKEPGKDRRCFTLRITRGFRHQIRCHLAWTGNPIEGDLLYGPGGAAAGAADSAVPPDSPRRVHTPAPWGGPESFLALRAQALYFFNPRDGRPLEFRIPSIGG
jgi:23S rRNA pseudouridine1911/1915/1917 synthase